MRKGRRRILWHRVGIVLVLFVAVVSLAGGAGFYIYKQMFNSRDATTMSNSGGKANLSAVSNRLNILVLGVDDGDIEHNGSAKRSDTMMVVSINSDDGTISLLSIPRDTRVEIPGRKGYDKVTHAYFYGGPNLAVKTVEQLLDLKIHHYISVDWQAFIKIIDILGGVNLYVENNMNYEDPYAGLSIHLTKGYQHLDGTKAGEYVRFRNDELGDIGRVQRQQRLIKAISAEVFKFETIFKLPALVGAANQYVATDINPVTMFTIANNLKMFKSDGLRTEMLPGNFSTIDGFSYWVNDQEQTKRLVEKLFTNKTANIGTVHIP